MSRIGKQPIKIPDQVEITTDDCQVKVKGPKGELKEIFDPRVIFEISDQVVAVKVKNDSDRRQRALWGLSASLIKNMIIGVTEGFLKKLEINGIGFGAKLADRKLIVSAGYSKPVEFKIPEGIEVNVEGNVITVSGIDKQLVGETAAQIRKIRKPEPYKGKGIKYFGEQIIRKAGKTAATKTE